MKDGEIKNKLSPAQVSVMRHRVTEPPYFGKFWDQFDPGMYRCAACETVLFSSDEKFDSKTGWPSFKKPVNERDLQFKSEPGPDDKVEIRCKKCKSHLGYVISGDSPYYRINSVCLIFEKREIPVASVAPVLIDAPTKNSADKKTEAIITSTDASFGMDEVAWNTRSLLVGALVGLLLGGIGTHAYITRTTPTVTPATATTTAEIVASTSAPVIEKPAATEKKKVIDISPAKAPGTTVSGSGTPQTATTSTQ